MHPPSFDEAVVPALNAIGPNSFASDADLYEAKEAMRRALARLETPFERVWTLSCEAPALAAGLQVGADLGVWSRWTELNKENGGAPQTLEDILGMCNTHVEPNLLRRFLRHLAAMYALEETDVDTWKPTTLTLAMGDSTTYIDQALLCGLDHTTPCGVNLARFLKKHEYQEPLDKTKLDNYREVFGDDFFDFCQKHPDEGGSFLGLMTALRNHKMDWTKVYDTKRLVADADVTGAVPLFVDVGGAHGLDAARLLAHHRDLPADVVVLEDLPAVLETTQAMETLDARVRRVPHDFFTPQPVVGARAYFFHAVPHDWPDADCVRIFGHIKPAMKRGYSKLLIYEVVVPARGATNIMTTLDLQLMNCTSGLERTEADWEGLLAQAGFRIVQIFRHPRAVESVIEAELVDE